MPLREAKSLDRLELRARDGNIGHVRDLFFDDQCWAVRYFVVDTGRWLSGRRVLISPAAMSGAIDEKSIPVNLTVEQVRRSPGVEIEQPVSREEELALTQYYNWPTYWMAGVADGNLGMTVPQPILAPEAMLPVREARVAHSVVAEHHLRSVCDVRGFEIESADFPSEQAPSAATRDRIVGRVEDFVVDTGDWRIPELLIDTGKGWRTRQIRLAVEQVARIGWERARLWTKLTRPELEGRTDED